MTQPMSLPLFSSTRLLTAVIGCAAWVALVAPVDSALAQGGAQTSGGVAEDDPFADELNPFGRGSSSAPAAQTLTPPRQSPAMPSGPATGQRPTTRLPVPFPETTVPGDRAPRPAERSRPGVSDRRSDAWEPTPAEKLLVEAEKLDKAGKLEEAREKLREVIKLDPKLTLGYLALGVTSRRLGDFEGSVDACSKGLEIDPQDSELYLRRGIAWFHLGLYGIALEDFEDAAGMAYDDPRPELWRGLALVELGRPLEAINAYASAIRRDRTYMLAYLNRGLAYLQTNQPRKAEFDFDQAIRHDPKDVRAWFNRGVAQAHQGKFADAVNSYGEALKRDPQHEPSRRNIEVARGRSTSARP
jgi:tetratricopeptide (TPR) repeat protein